LRVDTCDKSAHHGQEIAVSLWQTKIER